ncbi:hypothetical protein SprV_0602236500 [Sparganum proliferum]
MGGRSLVDTGAKPSPPAERRCSKLFLPTVNFFLIAAFGSRPLCLASGLRRQFIWIFVMADVNTAILGADIQQLSTFWLIAINFVFLISRLPSPSISFKYP